MKRIILAAFLGGLIVFIWSAIAHIATPLGMAGLSMFPDDKPMLDSFKANVPKSGMYFFPGMDMSHKPTHEEEKAWEEKIQAGPTGLLIITTGPGAAMTPRQLVSELVTNIVGAYIAAILAAMMVGTMMKRAFAIALLALFATVSLSLSYWIWYNFPPAFVLAELVTELIGWFLAGIAIAKIVPAANATRAVPS
jgi:hypothetical protein